MNKATYRKAVFLFFSLCTVGIITWKYLYPTSTQISTPKHKTDTNQNHPHTNSLPSNLTQLDSTNLVLDSTITDIAFNDSKTFNQYLKTKEKITNLFTSKNKDSIKTGASTSINKEQHKTILNGKALRVEDFKDYSKENVRGKLTIIFNSFQNHDHIDGNELAKVFEKYTTISKLLRGTVASYIRTHIAKIQREDSCLVIYTKESNGIHSNIKIPLVEKIHIDIANKSKIIFGKTFQSEETLFKNIYLLPIELQGIRFINHKEPFPSKGFVSGNYFYYEYANSRMAYPF